MPIEHQAKTIITTRHHYRHTVEGTAARRRETAIEKTKAQLANLFDLYRETQDQILATQVTYDKKEKNGSTSIGYQVFMSLVHKRHDTKARYSRAWHKLNDKYGVTTPKLL